MSKKKILIIIFIVLLLIVGAGSAWYILYGGKMGSDNITEEQSVVPTETATKDIITIIDSAKNLSKYAKLVSSTGVEYTLQTAGSKYMVLAPENDAYDSLPDDYYDSLFASDKLAIAQRLTKYTIINMPEQALVSGQKLKTLHGGEVIVGKQKGKFTFTDAKANVAVTEQTLKATNGTIYIIDSVLLPQ